MNVYSLARGRRPTPGGDAAGLKHRFGQAPGSGGGPGEPPRGGG